MARWTGVIYHLAALAAVALLGAGYHGVVAGQRGARPATAPCQLASCRVSAPPVVRARVGIMPLGDSITASYGSSYGTGYRGPLDRLLVTMPRAWLGSQGTAPLRHEGHGGWTCVQLLADVDGWVAAASTPGAPLRLVLLDAGTNDTRFGATGAATADCLAQMLDRLAVDAPGVRVVLAQITITTSASAAVQQEQQNLDNLLPGVAAARGPSVRVVDMRGVEQGDGIHPDDAGYQAMADRWNAAIAGWLW